MISVVKIALHKLQILIERFRGLDFSSVVDPSKLGFNPDVVHRGSPSGDKFLNKVLLTMNVTTSDSILDIGCAKGSALVCMANFPFSCVDGLEISKKLAEVCRKNFKLMGIEKTTIFDVDALEFNGYGKYNFFYLYNPFPIAIFKKVMDKILLSLPTENETIIIYNNPPASSILADYGFIKMIEFPDKWGNGIHVYSNTPTKSRLR